MKRAPQKNICFYFQVHQPYRLSPCSAFEVGAKENYFEGPAAHSNRAVFEKVAKKCYLPMNALWEALLAAHPELRLSFSFSGLFLEQCQEYGGIGAEVLESFKKLVATGRVEILSETHYHSLAWLFSKKEFAEQIRRHDALIWRLFKKKPRIFRNTELIYSNELAEFIRQMGFKGILAEGWDHVLGWRSPNHLYAPKTSDLHPADAKLAHAYAVSKTPSASIPLLLKNYRLSDDIAFRFGNRGWSQWPLTAEKFVNWASATEGETINLFMDYETFGEHQWEDTGIFEFMRYLPAECLKNNIGFRTPSETVKALKPVGEVDVPWLMSWADMERDLSAWRSNPLQEAALKRVFGLEQALTALSKKWPAAKQETMKDIWRKFQTSDHFYYMCTKYWNDGDVHAYFSPFESPYDAFIAYMNSLSDFEKKIAQKTPSP